MRILLALLSGAIFGIGLTVSEMINPAKVLGFLDILGSWDPSLAFVMGGALIASFIGVRLSQKSSTPVLTDSFHWPENTGIDGRLIAGAVLFGLGWALVGLCPGPAIAGLGFGLPESWTFAAAMLAGMIFFHFSLGQGNRLSDGAVQN